MVIDNHNIEIKKVTWDSSRTPQLTIHTKELGAALWRVVYQSITIDTAGCDLYTDSDLTYVAQNRDWIASRDPQVAALVDAANILTLGYALKMNRIEPATEN